jgi:hypothetical protein
MRVSRFKTRGGAIVLLTKNQELALERAGVWVTLGYTFVCEEEGKPSFTDRQMATQLAGYKGKTHIGMLHPEYRTPDLPYVVANPQEYEPSAACAGFADALNCAREKFRCDVVTVLERDYQPKFNLIAEQWRVVLLVV